jgi:hypothetical protein
MEEIRRTVNALHLRRKRGFIENSNTPVFYKY